jgi:preprotein translocase subunit SecF
MVIALIVFLVIVTIYIAIRFDKEMATASLASLFFDVIVTAGVYSLVGFEVSPATVIGLLTILGFSIYDTVVVFDKVEENTRSFMKTYRRTYAEQANLAVNQTLMRSINTTVISVLPIIALMVVAVWMLGVGTLQDLALIQLVGVVVGTFSSVFLATPMLVSLKERNTEIAAHTKKVLTRRTRPGAGEPVPADRTGGRHAAAGVGSGAGVETGAARPTGKRRRSR